MACTAGSAPASTPITTINTPPVATPGAVSPGPPRREAIRVRGTRHFIFGLRGRMIFGVLALVSLSLWLLGLMLMRQNASFLATERRARGALIARSFQKDLAALLDEKPPAALE